MKRRWNIHDAWPEPNKLTVRRRVKELLQGQKTAKQLAEARRRKIKRLRQRIAEMEAEDC